MQLSEHVTVLVSLMIGNSQSLIFFYARSIVVKYILDLQDPDWGEYWDLCLDKTYSSNKFSK